MVKQSHNMICYVCGKKFTSTKANLRRHMKEKHNIVEKVNYTVKCQEPSCDYMCPRVGDLRTHLQSVHNLDQQVEELHFKNVHDFDIWKEAEEVQTKSKWIKHNTTGTNTTYYYCNRSGKKRILDTEKRKRKLKTQGSCKIDSTCTSYITAKTNTDGSLGVTFYKTHYGHINIIEHVPLDKSSKNLIATQLLEGVSSTEILHRIKESMDDNFKRIHLTSKKDINNIARSYNLSDKVAKNQITIEMDLEAGEDPIAQDITQLKKDIMMKLGTLISDLDIIECNLVNIEDFNILQIVQDQISRIDLTGIKNFTSGMSQL